MQRLTANQLYDHLRSTQEPPRLIDVREHWEYEIVHLEGTQLFPLGQIHELEEALDPDEEVVLICHHGIRSLQVAHYLEHQGFTRVINLEGGIDAWARQVDPTLPTY
ncbi:MAG: rhodanese-like domain-containing protein [Pseudomonadota bacterium]|jgi:rhodanese-related sulfurtransferase